MVTGNIISLIGLLIIIIGIYVSIRVDITKLQAQIIAIKEKQGAQKLDMEKLYDRLREENRVDHQIMFKKMDSIMLMIKKNP